MIKILIASIAIVALAITGLINKDIIHEKYLQTQVNEHLLVSECSGIVNLAT